MIQIRSFSYEEWLDVHEINANNPQLSFADCSCLWLCGQLSATLLTSDGKLRSLAAEKGIPVHGILWAFDQLTSQNEITIGEAESKLCEIENMNNSDTRYKLEKSVLLHDIFEILESIAPEGCYFGSHPVDSMLIGFWDKAMFSATR